MEELYEVGKAKVLLSKPATETDEVILFLPGISGGAHSERFQPLVRAALGAGVAIARVSLWEGAEDVEKLSPKEIFTQLGEMVAFLQSKGYKAIAGVGKSFGGGMLYAYTDNRILVKVLWAPFMHYVQEGGNIDAVTFSELAHLSDLTVDLAHLEPYAGAVLFLHGTADTAIAPENSEILANALPQTGVVELIEGADHSYKNPEHEEEVIEKTISFIKKALA